MQTSEPKPLISVIIATFNSAKLLPAVLAGLKAQKSCAATFEVLLIDGGSTDRTELLGKEWGCRVIPNPRTEPVYAKFLGLQSAAGKYAIYVDHDEVFGNQSAFAKRLELFEKNPTLKAVAGSGYLNPAGYPIINRYINDFGDPFSFFIYRLSKDANSFPREMASKYKTVFENDSGYVFDFNLVKDPPIIELCAIGSMIDVNFFRDELADLTSEPSALPHFFYLMQSQTTLLGITKNDPIYHYSSESMARYLSKLKWRVKNNIYHSRTMGQAGFLGRQKFSSYKTKLRKILFLPYAFSIILPFIDSVVLCLRKRDPLYLIHVPLSFYTASLIVFHSAKNLLGFRPLLRSYDESTVVKLD